LKYSYRIVIRFWINNHLHIMMPLSVVVLFLLLGATKGARVQPHIVYQQNSFAMTEVKKEKKEKVEKKEKHDKADKADKKEKVEKKEKKDKKDKVEAVASPNVTSPVGEEDWDNNRTLIEAICKAPPNNMCNDCNQPGTRWASVNHGVFVCIRCSGIHRSLGVHISKVKSSNMDKWTASEIRLMELIGNRRAKELYEARLPKGFKPLSGTEPESVIRNFIVKKYDEKVFCTEGIADVLKKLYKQSGYGRKGGVPAASPLSPSGAKKAVSHEDPMKSLYGASASADKKKKKDKPIEGSFGTVTVPTDEHDALLKQLLENFGVVEAIEEASEAAAEETEASTETAAVAE
jgi:hypothetical protein